MKILCGSDLHYRSEIKRRKDDYLETLSNKLIWSLNLAKEIDAQFFIIGGDIFDTFRAPDYLKRKLIQIFNRYYPRILTLCVAGQHDQRFHQTNLENTPLGVLETANSVHILNENPFRWVDINTGKPIEIYGSGWMSSIPTADSLEDSIKILVVHKMLSDKDYWSGNVGYSDAQKFLEEYEEFDLIVSGDNHTTFVLKDKERILVNCGSFGRQKIDQADHRPCIFSYDTKTKKIEQHFIPTKPFSEVMDLEEETEEINENLENLALELSKTDEIGEGLDYVKNLHSYKQKNNIDEETWQIIQEALNE